jgi:hypothetical protein
MREAGMGSVWCRTSGEWSASLPPIIGRPNLRSRSLPDSLPPPTPRRRPWAGFGKTASLRKWGITGGSLVSPIPNGFRIPNRCFGSGWERCHSEVIRHSGITLSHSEQAFHSERVLQFPKWSSTGLFEGQPRGRVRIRGVPPFEGRKGRRRPQCGTRPGMTTAPRSKVVTATPVLSNRSGPKDRWF